MTPSAGSVWLIGWTKGLCRIHGRHPVGRSALSPMYEFLVISYRVESFLKSPGGNRRFWPPVSMPSENITRVFGLSKSPGLLKSIFFFRGLLATGQNYGQLYSLCFKVGVNP